MAKAGRGRIVLHALETLYALAAAAWFALPLAAAAGIAGLDRLGAGYGAPWGVVLGGVAALAWLPAAVAAAAALVLLAKLAALGLGRVVPAVFDPGRPVAIALDILLSAAVIATLAAGTLRGAASGAWFAALPLPQYGAFGASLAWNAASISLLLASINRRDASFREYLDFRRASGERVSVVGITAHGIQGRLAVTYIPMILAAIVVLSWVLMRDYSGTLLEAVIDGGRSLAERTAGTVKANADDMIAVEDVLAGEAERNRGATLPFRAITLYWKAPRTGAVSVAASTDAARRGAAGRVEDEPSGTGYRLLEDGRVYEFRSPVTLAGRPLGWVAVEYARDVIYEPVFRSQVKVTLIAALFVYAAVFLTWVFGQAVVLPILYLRMSVVGIAARLRDMIAGTASVSAAELEYRDRVKTRDEIHELSGAIGNMTGVLRGLLPYISTQTLRHAAQEKREHGSAGEGKDGTVGAAARDLALLFTDIRNFTAKTEGQPPEAVIRALNRCHDLQTKAILESHGDVDSYIGDGLFARFEGPEKELNACRAAFAIRAAMAEERRRAADSRELVFTAVGIGIGAGLVVTGDIGTEQRRHFTAIGYRVNLASRLEGANKVYGTSSLVTDSVARVAARAFLLREIDLVTVKGMQQPVRIHELLAPKAKPGERAPELARAFALGLAAYRARQWDKAAKAFSLLVEKYQDAPSRVFLARVKAYAARPPAKDWNGAWPLTVK